MGGGLSGVAVRDQNVPASAGGSFFEAFRATGADSFEAAVAQDESIPCLGGSVAEPASLHDRGSIEAIRSRLASQGARISAFLLATDFSAEDAERHVETAVRTVEAAAALGVPVVRIDPLTAQRALPPAAVTSNFIRRVRQILDLTTHTGVDLGMENHAQVFNDPRVLDEVLAALPDPRFGLTLDTGNFYWWGHPIDVVYELVERYAPRTRHTHIKNIHYPPEIRNQQRETGFEYKRYCSPLFEGDLDLRRIVQTLRRGGYGRDLCVEDESLSKFPEAQRLDVLRRDVAFLRAAL